MRKSLALGAALLLTACQPTPDTSLPENDALTEPAVVIAEGAEAESKNQTGFGGIMPMDDLLAQVKRDAAKAGNQNSAKITNCWPMPEIREFSTHGGKPKEGCEIDTQVKEFDALAARFSRLALDCVQREYPNKIAHTMTSDRDALPPRELHPAFYGCFDWHSSVHGHWLLVRLLRLSPSAPWREEAIAKLSSNLTPENLAAEAAYLGADERGSFERPYGLAWLLQLSTELRQWDDPQAKIWLGALAPLEAKAVEKTKAWLPNLAYPIRLGTHNQSAFAFGLMLDYAKEAGDAELTGLIMARSREYYLSDVNCPMAYEPSGEDFLSPCLMEADLMRRILSPAAFESWFSAFLPNVPKDGSADWLAPGIVKDASDGKLVHLDGVNLSRAWALEGIASALPPDDQRIPALIAAAAAHRRAGLAAVSDEHYSGSHWLASFATYLITQRGLR